MKSQLDQYVDTNLVKQNGTWYSINNEKLGQRKAAEAKLKELIETGKIEKLDTTENVSETLPPSMSMPEVDGEGGKPAELLPVIKPNPKVNPALKNKTEEPKEIHDIFKSLAADLGDIETRKKGGRFKIYIFGVDSRLENNELVKKCPYVFRHNDKKRNIRSGNTTFNEGWTVLSKKLIEKDPRTGKPWLTVARDDTPDEDMFTVSNYVLCYADKNQFKRKKGKMAMENMLKSGAIADQRQETAERMATASKVDPAQSMQGYMTANKADQSIAKEQLENNTKFSSNEAQEYIDNLNALGSRETDIDKEVENMRKLVDSGKIGKTLSTKPLTMDEL